MYKWWTWRDSALCLFQLIYYSLCYNVKATLEKSRDHMKGYKRPTIMLAANLTILTQPARCVALTSKSCYLTLLIFFLSKVRIQNFFNENFPLTFKKSTGQIYLTFVRVQPFVV